MIETPLQIKSGDSSLSYTTEGAAHQGNRTVREIVDLPKICTIDIPGVRDLHISVDLHRFIFQIDLRTGRYYARRMPLERAFPDLAKVRPPIWDHFATWAYTPRFRLFCVSREFWCIATSFRNLWAVLLASGIHAHCNDGRH